MQLYLELEYGCDRILCRFHAIVILTLGVYTIVLALSLSSLLTPKALGDPIALNNEPKSVSLIRI